MDMIMRTMTMMTTITTTDNTNNTSVKPKIMSMMTIHAASQESSNNKRAKHIQQTRPSDESSKLRCEIGRSGWCLSTTTAVADNLSYSYNLTVVVMQCHTIAFLPRKLCPSVSFSKLMTMHSGRVKEIQWTIFWGFKPEKKKFLPIFFSSWNGNLDRNSEHNILL